MLKWWVEIGSIGNQRYLTISYSNKLLRWLRRNQFIEIKLGHDLYLQTQIWGQRDFGAYEAWQIVRYFESESDDTLRNFLK